MPLFNFTFRAMAAENELQLVAPDEPTARRVADLAIADVQRIESKYSRYRDDSDHHAHQSCRRQASRSSSTPKRPRCFTMPTSATA